MHKGGALEVEAGEEPSSAQLPGKKVDGPLAPDRISCDEQTERSYEPGDKEASGNRLSFQQRKIRRRENKVQRAWSKWTYLIPTLLAVSILMFDPTWKQKERSMASYP